MTDYDADPAYDELLLPPPPPRQQKQPAPAPAKKGGENVPLWCSLMLILAVVNVWFGVANGNTASFVVAVLLGAAALYYWNKHNNSADRPRAAAADDDADDDMVTLHNGQKVTRERYEDLRRRAEAHRERPGQQPPRNPSAAWDDDEAGF